MLVYETATGKRYKLLYYKMGIAVCEDRKGVRHFIITELKQV